MYLCANFNRLDQIYWNCCVITGGKKPVVFLYSGHIVLYPLGASHVTGQNIGSTQINYATNKVNTKPNFFSTFKLNNRYVCLNSNTLFCIPSSAFISIKRDNYSIIHRLLFSTTPDSPLSVAYKITV